MFAESGRGASGMECLCLVSVAMSFDEKFRGICVCSEAIMRAWSRVWVRSDRRQLSECWCACVNWMWGKWIGRARSLPRHSMLSVFPGRPPVCEWMRKIRKKLYTQIGRVSLLCSTLAYFITKSIFILYIHIFSVFVLFWINRKSSP